MQWCVLVRGLGFLGPRPHKLSWSSAVEFCGAGGGVGWVHLDQQPSEGAGVLATPAMMLFHGGGWALAGAQLRPVDVCDSRLVLAVPPVGLCT